MQFCLSAWVCGDGIHKWLPEGRSTAGKGELVAQVRFIPAVLSSHREGRMKSRHAFDLPGIKTCAQVQVRSSAVSVCP